MELPAGSAALHSAGLVVEQAPDPSFWVQFNTHNVNAHKPAASSNNTEPAEGASSGISAGGLAGLRALNKRIAESAGYDEPWFENRDGEGFCTLCGKWATPDHIANDKHLKRTKKHAESNTRLVEYNPFDRGYASN